MTAKPALGQNLTSHPLLCYYGVCLVIGLNKCYKLATLFEKF